MKRLIGALFGALLLCSAPLASAQSVITESYAVNVPAPKTWTDLVVATPAIASTTAYVNNVGTSRVVVSFTASASAPVAGGIVLEPGQRLTGNAAHVWVRAVDTAGALTLGLVQSAGAGGASTVTGNAASGSVDSGNPVKMGCVFNSTPPTFTTGQRGDCQIYARGQLVISQANSSFTLLDGVGNSANVPVRPDNAAPLFAPSIGYYFNGTSYDRVRGDTTGMYSVRVPSAAAASGTAPLATSAAAASLVGKASAGTLFGINATAAASAGYVLVFNATTAPADGAVTPARCIPLAANTGIEMNYRDMPIYFSTGIVAVFSTTGCFTKTASATAFLAVDVK